MKGQKLYIRPVSADDRPEVDRLYRHESGPPDTIESGIVGRLTGDLVAHVAYSAGDRSLEISSVIVRSDLRRIRIGTHMIGWLERVARERSLSRLVVRPDDEHAGFFRQLGFELVDGMLQKKI